jgi:hypothetical protein
MSLRVCRYLCIAASVLACSVAGADDPIDLVIAEAVPLPEHELRQITVALTQRYPQLAGSPGVKASSLYSGGPSGPGTTVASSIVYYPHTESRGIKEAFEALCRRTYPSSDWTCDEVRIRRYLQIESQRFEVRVLAGITAAVAVALIEGSRRELLAGATDRSAVPATAVLITEHHEQRGQYFVTWGTPEGESMLTMLAQLAAGGDPERSADWRVRRVY